MERYVLGGDVVVSRIHAPRATPGNFSTVFKGNALPGHS